MKVFSVTQEHQTQQDDLDIDSVFHSYSHMAKSEGDDDLKYGGIADSFADSGQREIPIENGYQASMEIFSSWGLELSNAEE